MKVDLDKKMLADIPVILRCK
ncbi:hypothetical protein C5167_035299 [Papaver somniferum]|uniref:Uncharacterized protein n=1 Tax=Papaver somniferum TaxID=3469 RepID=A0A4Y7KJS3_PAPSO|nr:hypothetical protein C5167_035299 [Papaver somniferum]